LGSDFDVIVVDGKILVRGRSELPIFAADTDEYGQLGTADTSEDFIDLSIQGSVVGLRCARWSTIITMK
jgi:hypothetical protein